jgi:hypothetical protein
MGDISDQQVAPNIISHFLEVKFSGSGVAMGYHIFSPQMILQVFPSKEQRLNISGSKTLNFTCKLKKK